MPTLFDTDISEPERRNEHHPRVRFRGPKYYEASGIVANRMRYRFMQVFRFLKRRRRLLRKSKSRPAVAAAPASLEKLTALIEKTKEMDSASFVKTTFKNLSFSSEKQQSTAKTLFLSRLYTAQAALAMKGVSTKTRRPLSKATYRLSGTRRLALKVTRVSNAKQREAGL